MGKKYKVMLLSITVLLVASILLGTSYSIWTSTNKQVGTNVINVGCFKITFTDTGLSENGVNAGDINLQKAYPISESDGSSLTPYMFNIKNECSIAANYTVNLETLADSNFNLDYLRIKFNDVNAVTNNSVIYNELPTDADTTIDGSTASKTLTTGYLEEGEEATYSLRAWIDYEATTETANVMGRTWKGKIIVNSEATPKKVISTIDSCPGCVYAYTTDTWYYSGTPTTLTPDQYKENYHDVVAETGKNYFLGLKLDNSGTIENAYACGIKDETPFCVGVLPKDTLLRTLYGVYGPYSSSTNTGCNIENGFMDCYGSVNAGFDSIGREYVGDGTVECHVISTDFTVSCTG